MRSNRHAESVQAPRTSRALRSLAIGVLLLGGCGGNSGLQGRTGGTTSMTPGTDGGSQGSAGAGGTAGATGGAPATGGTSSSGPSAGAPGGATTVSTSAHGGGGASAGGATVAGGGKTTLGGSTNVGGATTGPGGTTKTGGSTSTGGATTGLGGTAKTGGSTGAGGSGGSTSAGGGSARGGATASAGSTGTAGNPDAGAGDGGIVASGYCEGGPKLTYQGQTVSAPATDYTSNIVMDCCQGYAVNLHSSASLGFDVQVDLLLSINVTTPGEYDIGGTSIRVRAAVSHDGEGTGGVNTQGSLRILSADTTAGLWKARLCLEVVGTTSPLLGTRIYVPEVIMGSYSSDKRFQIFLLKDATLRTDSAAVSQPLDSLVLADSPLLDLGRIAFVEKSTGKFGLNPGQKIGDSTRSRLGTPLGLPFVALADGIRIYLGTFTSGVSSIRPLGPWVEVEEIKPDGFVLQAPWSGPDPRNDERILKALSERGKLVP